MLYIFYCHCNISRPLKLQKFGRNDLCVCSCIAFAPNSVDLSSCSVAEFASWTKRFHYFSVSVDENYTVYGFHTVHCNKKAEHTPGLARDGCHLAINYEF